ncbi:TetR/AcrR family transcriptional regulator [Anaerocolumna xylanovorans]|uniref:Transcriptional regulator, TetR family n=1 Tax=Anaerocolumna xylanovorans DSM 12503 TaxID=1121345 RepID=A0A1M7YJE8_9FIRM|nr:TetR/AcrR family transcriptional regulator [Anaerocolumna xylanovorans]SHO52737.1 transcriptional regulator, TetR family [Anaerocolumna xylanovorans DSM 12503]
MPKVLDEMDKKILEVSRELFLTKGIRETEMKDIAKKTGIGRSTLYRHFTGKELIAFYIAKDILSSLKDSIEGTLIEQKDLQNGFQKLEKGMDLFAEKLISSREEIRFLDEFDQYFTDSYPESEEASEYIQFNKNKDMGIYRMFLEGMKDGSIKKVENPEFAADVLVNAAFGIAQRVIPRREHYIEEHGYCEEMLKETVKLMLQGIKS